MHPLQKLLTDNRGRGSFRAESANADEATLFLYDVVVSDEATSELWGGIAPKPFAELLNGLTAPTIHLRINSPGGDVFAARAIEQHVRNHPSRIVTHVDGHAASAASYIALAADEVVINPGGYIMIHNAWSFAFGNAADLTAIAKLLTSIAATLADTYVKETGQARDQVEEWMADETWFNAQDAVKFGFADRLEEDPVAKALAWNLSAYAHAPDGAARPGKQQKELNTLADVEKRLRDAGISRSEAKRIVARVKTGDPRDAGSDLAACHDLASRNINILKG